MIVWIASYPKSGNTYLRSFLSSYYYSDEGKFEFSQLANIRQFPNIKFSKSKMYNNEEASKNWIYNQNLYFKKEDFNLVKTHNCLYPYNGHQFTSANETIGAIYIVRDPRNVITSMKHHYALNYEMAFKHMVNENASLLETTADKDFSNFTFLNSWSNHYKSWKNNSIFKVLFIKYEDLEKDKENTFIKIVKFVNLVMGKKDYIDLNKLRKSISTTNFDTLQKKERDEGFDEATYSLKDGKKRTFFNLGSKNDYKKLLKSETISLIEEIYKKEMKELGYI